MSARGTREQRRRERQFDTLSRSMEIISVTIKRSRLEALCERHKSATGPRRQAVERGALQLLAAALVVCDLQQTLGLRGTETGNSDGPDKEFRVASLLRIKDCVKDAAWTDGIYKRERWRKGMPTSD